MAVRIRYSYDQLVNSHAIRAVPLHQGIPCSPYWQVKWVRQCLFCIVNEGVDDKTNSLIPTPAHNHLNQTKFLQDSYCNMTTNYYSSWDLNPWHLCMQVYQLGYKLNI